MFLRCKFDLNYNFLKIVFFLRYCSLQLFENWMRFATTRNQQLFRHHVNYFQLLYKYWKVNKTCFDLLSMNTMTKNSTNVFVRIFISQSHCAWIPLSMWKTIMVPSRWETMTNGEWYIQEELVFSVKNYCIFLRSRDPNFCTVLPSWYACLLSHYSNWVAFGQTILVTGLQNISPKHPWCLNIYKI